MNVGLISDIHGNRVALEAVLDDMPPVDELVCLGDIVGYNPWPAECVDLVRDHADVTVIGNHGRRLINGYEMYRANRMAYEGLALADDRLSDAQKDWLASLPEETTAADGQLRLVHSHPNPDIRWSSEGYVYPRDFPQMVEYLAAETYPGETEDSFLGLAMGHTHDQHAVDMGKYDNTGLIVNPGSVGQPRDNDPRAAYAVVDTAAAQVELERVDYDIEAVQAAISDADLPDKTGQRLADGT